ncbi:MAG: AarF/ABC1/UbiB kinase family protein [Planctomycetes bacterium]|nr:AarF/ABC1/UbiB kinase family protein [Planctomycetota bacterium]
MAIRKIGIVSRTYQHVNRYRQILTVLIKYGFDDLVDRLKIGQYLEIGLQMIARRDRAHIEKHTRAERVRMTLEELGPTFVKLGQIASTRPDLIPAEFVSELEKLRDAVPPFPFEQVRRIVETELNQPLEELFASFEQKSLAAASIGQVHRARLNDGEDVVVKVQRPNIRHTIEVDLEIMLHLATLLERHVEEAELHRPTRIVEEFARVMEQELDYDIERAHLERFANLFLDDDTVYVPKVYRDYSTHRVLTMEYITGVNVSDLDAIMQNRLSRRQIAARGAELILKQVFVHGFFHADPHPGNVFALPGNVICYLDFGMVGRVDRHTREIFADLVYGAAARDAGKTTAAILRLAEHEDEWEVDARALERDVGELIDVHVVTELGRVDMGRLLQQLLELLSKHRLRIPADLVMMLKAMATAEGVGVMLDPQIDLIKIATPYVRKLKLERLSPRRLVGELFESGNDLLQLAREIPAGARELLRLAKRGNLRMGVEHRGFEKMLDTYEHTANRVAFAIVVAALIVGSSLIVVSDIPPKWGGIPLIGVVGFIAAGIMGLVLLVAIIRHGRM